MIMTLAQALAIIYTGEPDEDYVQTGRKSLYYELVICFS